MSGEEEGDLRRGPWTREEDNLLIHSITCHGEGRWNMLAKGAGKRDEPEYDNLTVICVGN